jgi:hypothetical protein
VVQISNLLEERFTLWPSSSLLTLRHIRSSTLSGRGTKGGDDDAIDVVAVYCGDVGVSHRVEYLAPILYGLAGGCRLAMRLSLISCH